MKKPYIYAVVLSALLIIGALVVIYQVNNPGIMIPSKAYTEMNTKKLTADHRVTAEQFGIDEKVRGSTVYAAAIEETRRDIRMTVFDYVDIRGERYTALSNGDQRSPKELTEDEVKKLFESLAGLYDANFSFAEKTDYRIPDYDQVKVYIRRGDGVYFRIYEKNEIPDVVKQYLDGR